MRTTSRNLAVLALGLFMAAGPRAGVDSGHVIDLMGSHCEHGPRHRPEGGPFTAFIFCDSALGSNLGIILSRLTNETDTGDWGVDRRFWQEGPWVTDVTSIAWDPHVDRIFVATSEVYGDGGVFALDLVGRKFERIYSIDDIDAETVREKARALRAETHYGFIERLDLREGTVTVSIRLAHGDGGSTIIGEKTIPLGTGNRR